MKEKKLTELELLTDDIVGGKRTVLFAPGLWSVIATILLLLVSTVLLSGSLISIYGSEMENSSKAIYQLAGLFSIFLFVILPGLLLFRGYRASKLVKLVYALTLAVICTISIVLGGGNSHMMPLLISLGTSLSGGVLVNSSAYKLCSEFYYLLRIKKRR